MTGGALCPPGKILLLFFPLPAPPNYSSYLLSLHHLLSSKGWFTCASTHYLAQLLWLRPMTHRSTIKHHVQVGLLNFPSSTDGRNQEATLPNTRIYDEHLADLASLPQDIAEDSLSQSDLSPLAPAFSPSISLSSEYTTSANRASGRLGLDLGCKSSFFLAVATRNRTKSVRVLLKLRCKVTDYCIFSRIYSSYCGL